MGKNKKSKKSELQYRWKCAEIFVEDQSISIECFFCKWRSVNSLQNDVEMNCGILKLTRHLEESHLPHDDDENEKCSKELSEMNEEVTNEESTTKSEFVQHLSGIVAADHNYGSTIKIEKEIVSNFSDDLYFGDIQSSSIDCIDDKTDEVVEIASNEGVNDNENKKFYCKICATSFKLRRLHMQHMRAVHQIFSSLKFEPFEDGKYHCTVCSVAVYYKPIFLSNHIKKRHEEYYQKLLKMQQNELIESEILKNNLILGIPKGNYNNPIVEKKIRYPKNFGMSNDGLWHCPKCDVTRKTQERIKFHFKERHIKNTTCNICGKELTTHKSLEQHILTHSGEKKLKCPYCNKAFLNRSGYQAHVRIHEGDKRYKCDYCDKTFIQRSEKKIHETRMHIKKYSIQCDVCGKGYYRPYDLSNHMRRHTGEKPSKCEVCFKSFFDNKLLKDHMVTHSKEKPFECEICFTKFSRKTNLATHKLLHSSIKNYHCNLCGDSFTQNAGLYSHKKTNHIELKS